MIKVKVGGYLFNLKSAWHEVSKEDAIKLYNTFESDLWQRLMILSDLPKIQTTPEATLALYEIISFCEDLPLVGKEGKKISEWTFKEFELVRQAIVKWPDMQGLSLGRVAEVMDCDLLEAVGCLEELAAFMDGWKDTPLFNNDDKEESALTAFGTYGILESVGEKFGKLPREIEEEKAVWIFTEWLHNYYKEKANK
jgi:hypothetical protein